MGPRRNLSRREPVADGEGEGLRIRAKAWTLRGLTAGAQRLWLGLSRVFRCIDGQAAGALRESGEWEEAQACLDAGCGSRASQGR